MPSLSLVISGNGGIKQELPGCNGDEGMQPGLVSFDLGEIFQNNLHTCNCASLKVTLELAGGGVQKVKCHVGWMGVNPTRCAIGGENQAISTCVTDALNYTTQ